MAKNILHWRSELRVLHKFTAAQVRRLSLDLTVGVGGECNNCKSGNCEDAMRNGVACDWTEMQFDDDDDRQVLDKLIAVLITRAQSALTGNLNWLASKGIEPDQLITELIQERIAERAKPPASQRVTPEDYYLDDEIERLGISATEPNAHRLSLQRRGEELKSKRLIEAIEEP